jgi:parallel beta-helix repeat protein
VFDTPFAAGGHEFNCAIQEPGSSGVGSWIQGAVEDTGTFFEVTNSKYLNITLQSGEPVHLVLESVPRMISMSIAAAEGATSTNITIKGFLPSTTYYKYEDDYHGRATFTTDAKGSYSYAQDLNKPHLIFIMPQPSTKFIPSDGSIGTWDPVTRTYTLSVDVDETIQIDEDDLILDGAGYSVLGAGSGCGLYLHVYIEGFSFGIHLHNSSGNILEHNTINGNSRYGIYLQNSTGNTLTENTTSDNHEGIFLRDSSGNDLTANTASKNYSGIYLYQDCTGNVLAGNTANKNSHGIYLYNSTDNTLAGNTANLNDYYGIYLHSNCNNNILTNNTASWNHNCGIYLNNSSGNTISDNTTSNNYPGIYFYYNCNNNALTGNTISDNYYGIYFNYNCNNNEVYRNNFIDNRTQVLIYSSSENIFSFPAPTGGNYWSDWTTPNADGDTFIDNPYLFTPTQDDLPWVRQNAWANQSPTADAGPVQSRHPGDASGGCSNLRR